MHKLTVMTLGLASALTPAIAASPPIAPPAPPASPAPPAGITWRHQAEPMPGMVTPPPIAPRVAPGELVRRHFVIRRGPGMSEEGAGDVLIGRDLDTDGGPARVIVRRERMDEIDPYRGDSWMEDEHEPPFAYESDDEEHGGYDEEPRGDEDWIDEGAYHHGASGYKSGDEPSHHPGYIAGPCCSGGMITETITTTTTYPPTVEERIVHQEVRHHRPITKLKRKLRR